MESNKWIETVCAAYPDAYCKRYATYSYVIWSVLCGQISLYFKTEDEAWEYAYNKVIKQQPPSPPQSEPNKNKQI